MSTVFSFAFLFQQDYQNGKSESSNKQTEQIQEKKNDNFNQLQDKNRYGMEPKPELIVKKTSHINTRIFI